MSRMSVAMVLIAPVIIISACCCMDASLFTIACLGLPLPTLLPTFFCGVRKMSAAYNMCGTVMVRYSLCTYLAMVLCDAHVILANWIIQLCPFARAAAPCAFQLSLLLTIFPRNFAVSTGGMQWLPSMSALHGSGILFLGLRVCGIIFLDMLSSWNFLIPNSQLCILAHAKTPSVLFMMLQILSCVSWKSFPITSISTSSTYRRMCLPSLIIIIFSMSTLYSR